MKDPTQLIDHYEIEVDPKKKKCKIALLKNGDVFRSIALPVIDDDTPEDLIPPFDEKFCVSEAGSWG